MALLREVAEYRAARRQFRWDAAWFTEEAANRWIAARELVVAHLNGKLIGAMLLQATDTRFWADYPEGEAMFVHRLARSPGAKIEGGLAAPMLNWALTETRKVGKPWLRIDCAPLDALCDIYAACGFTRVDLKEIEPDFWSVRWEKRA
jgi:hypothetical protein